MTDATTRVVDVYPYRERAKRPQFLLLRRVEGTSYAGDWRMVAGKIKPDEAAWQAALRELREETGRTPDRFWTVPSVNAFYEWREDRINLIPAFAASISGDPVLDDEHDEYGWWPAAEARDRLQWPEQQRLLRLTAQVLRNGIPPSLIVDT